MAFKFSARSEAHLVKVWDRLAFVARDALSRSRIDFGISSGLRSTAEQRALWEAGKSQASGTSRFQGGTGRSRHQDGAAIDVFAWAHGKVQWDLDWYFPIAEAFAAAAADHGEAIRWGGAWHCPDIGEACGGSGTESPATVHEQYVKLRRTAGRKPFIDAVHFEIPATRSA